MLVASFNAVDRKMKALIPSIEDSIGGDVRAACVQLATVAAEAIIIAETT